MNTSRTEIRRIVIITKVFHPFCINELVVTNVLVLLVHQSLQVLQHNGHINARSLGNLGKSSVSIMIPNTR